MLRLRALLPLLFLLAVLVRLPTLGLPLEGESAVLASVADSLGHDRGWTLAGQAPLMPILVSIGVASGANATSALRFTDVLLAALLAPLLVLLARRLGASGRMSGFAGLLMAVHPLGLSAAGGVSPGSGTPTTLLLLVALFGLLSKRPSGRRLGAAFVLFLVLSDAGALPYVPGLLWLYLRREPAARIQTGVAVLGACLLIAASVLWLDLRAPEPLAPGQALLWLALAGLLLLLPALPAGLSALWKRDSVVRVWMVSAGLAVLLGLFGAAYLALPLLPLLLLASLWGLPQLFPVRARRLSMAALSGAVVLSAWFVLGGLQVAVVRGAAPPAGRLYLLKEAMFAAAETAGERGWIVLAIGENSPALQASLADLRPDHWTWAQRSASGAEGPHALRRLRVFPAASLEAGRSVAVVAEAGTLESIHTFDGAGIYQQEVVQRLGPYVVLRAKRP